jgi:hypothetical protein
MTRWVLRSGEVGEEGLRPVSDMVSERGVTKADRTGPKKSRIQKAAARPPWPRFVDLDHRFSLYPRYLLPIVHQFVRPCAGHKSTLGFAVGAQGRPGLRSATFSIADFENG